MIILKWIGYFCLFVSFLCFCGFVYGTSYNFYINRETLIDDLKDLCEYFFKDEPVEGLAISVIIFLFGALALLIFTNV